MKFPFFEQVGNLLQKPLPPLKDGQFVLQSLPREEMIVQPPIILDKERESESVQSNIPPDTAVAGDKSDAQTVLEPPKKQNNDVIPEEDFPFPQKGDVFQDATSGDRIAVGTIAKTKGGKPQIYYTRTDIHGIEKNRRAQGEKKHLENFRVLVAGMEKTDPIKEQYPEFYALYEGEMMKLENAFIREFEASRTMIESWNAFVDEEYGPYLSGEIDDPEKKKEGEEILQQSQSIHEKIETIGEEWNKLDDHIVEQGRQGFLLFAELHALEASLPDYALELKISELKSLENEQGDDKPDIELVEKGYQKVLLDRKVDALKKKCEQSTIAFSGDIADDAPSPPEFVRQVDEWAQSVDEHSSSAEIMEVWEKLDAFEKRIFLGKKDKNDGGIGEDDESIGGRVKQISPKKSGYTEQKTEEGKKKFDTKKPKRGKQIIFQDESEQIVSSMQNNSVESEERSYETLYQSLGHDDKEIFSEEQRLADALRDGLNDIRDQIGVESIIEHKEKIITAFSQKFVDGLEKFSWTASEKNLFSNTFVRKCVEEFVK
ncbi:MAG: hypothetical protein PHH40_02985 [Candidatus Moranbacteria bacterium]|nr:hypothetical protein [Candidatus Moranbacteria bacterium]MDD3965148.1 hypothetical protein [Candidatus Moranbacteria bacterium]